MNTIEFSTVKNTRVRVGIDEKRKFCFIQVRGLFDKDKCNPNTDHIVREYFGKCYVVNTINLYTESFFKILCVVLSDGDKEESSKMLMKLISDEGIHIKVNAIKEKI